MNVTINNRISASVKLNVEVAVLICHSKIKVHHHLFCVCLLNFGTDRCKTREQAVQEHAINLSVIYVGSDKCKDRVHSRTSKAYSNFRGSVE
jgi:hypothetical protein